MRCVHSQREGAPDSTAAVTPKKIFPPACVIFTKALKFSQKYGIISTEKRNIAKMQDNIKSNYEKVKDYEQKTNYSNDC